MNFWYIVQQNVIDKIVYYITELKKVFYECNITVDEKKTIKSSVNKAQEDSKSIVINFKTYLLEIML